MYRTGSVAGDTGPTIFLLKGQRKRVSYMDQFLLENGAAIGSTIVMTENAFMTMAAWEELMPLVCKGLRAINKFVANNPQWYMLEIFDGFGAHLSSYMAMTMRFDNKILSLKEEGDSSHVNQAYDKFVAKGDKAAKRESLAMQRSMSYASGVVDQWQLIHTGLYAVPNTNRKTWTNSFSACNLDPHT